MRYVLFGTVALYLAVLIAFPEQPQLPEPRVDSVRWIHDGTIEVVEYWDGRPVLHHVRTPDGRVTTEEIVELPLEVE